MSDEGQVILIDKPSGWTSFDVVKKMRGILKIKKIGHAGTLDPLATGLLIVCTGRKTKEIQKYMELEKEYEGKFCLGKTTPSFDLETEPDHSYTVEHLDPEKIRAAVDQFIGRLEQVPPAFSAVKIQGRRAYKHAREGKTVNLGPKIVFIHEFEITSINLPEVSFRVVCSKGTYIRSLARDYGKALDSGAYLSSLRRTRIGQYSVEEAKQISDVEKDTV